MTNAGLLRRLGAMLYDALLLTALLMVATLLLLPFTGGEAVPAWAMRVWVPVIAFAFFGGFWTRGGQTLGMKAWRVRAERLDGEPLRWRDAAKRFVLAVPSIVSVVGLLWMLVDRDRLALHDRWSGTRVVRVVQ